MFGAFIYMVLINRGMSVNPRKRLRIKGFWGTANRVFNCVFEAFQGPQPAFEAVPIEVGWGHHFLT